jgi:hypothetical protein
MSCAQHYKNVWAQVNKRSNNVPFADTFPIFKIECNSCQRYAHISYWFSKPTLDIGIIGKFKAFNYKEYARELDYCSLYRHENCGRFPSIFLLIPVAAISFRDVFLPIIKKFDQVEKEPREEVADELWRNTCKSFTWTLCGLG